MSGPLLHDPDALIRHRGIRAMVAMTTTFAIGTLVLDNANVALFGAFGSFALLAFADFGGRPATRTRAYLTLVALGAMLVVLGTAASQHVVAGAVLLAVLTFVILLAGVFGGYYAAGGSAALLIFVIAVMVPAPMADVVSRELGWLLGGAVAIVTASVLWPVPAQTRLRRAVAAIVDDLADRVRSGTEPTPESTADLRRRVDELRDAYAHAAMRPAGPAEHEQALVRLLDETQRAVSFATRLPGVARRTHVVGAPDDGVLADAIADTFAHTASVLRGSADASAASDLVAIREDHRSALERWIGDALRRRQPPDEIEQHLSATFSLRVLSHTALSCEADAILTMGGRLTVDDPELLLDTPPGGRGAAATVRRAAALVRPHLRPGSVAFRNALRAAVALSAALVVAKVAQAEHGFWVVLGTLTVLKSSAMRTGITALEALAGNLIGFALAVAVLAVAGDHTAALWVILPVTIFLAAYAPAAVHFVVGQASFALMVVILFNLIQPDGWRTGLVRVESVALGAAVSIVIGVVLWPRGNRQALRDATVARYRSIGRYLAACFDSLLPPHRSDPDEVDRAQDEARSVELQADAALFDLLTTPVGAGVPVPAWVRVTSVGRSLRLVGDGVRAIPRRGYLPLIEGTASDDLARLAGQRVAEVVGVADRIERGGPADVHLDDPETAWLGAVDPDDADALNRALAMTWAIEWIQYIDLLVAVDEDPLHALAATAETPWWR